MLYLQLHAVSDSLRALFNPHQPASLRCFGVLDGIVAGEIIADQVHEPTWAVIREKAFGTTYLGGELHSEQIAEIIEKLIQTGDVLIGIDVGSTGEIWLPPKPDYHGRTLEFTGRSAQIDLDSFIKSLPAHLRIEQMDANLAKQCLWYDSLVHGHGSPERFFEHGHGFCLMDKHQILCEVYATCYLPQLAEIGVITHEAHRRQGYAAALCAHAIQVYEAANIATYWNCARQNIASAALARKLGYQIEREYTLLAWFKPKQGEIA